MTESRDYNCETEYAGRIINGFVMLLLWLIFVPACGVCAIALGGTAVAVSCGTVAAVLFLLLPVGLFTQEPNEARVMIFFGKYKGTFRRTGFYWVNPFMARKRLSLRIRNMDVEPIKVNDKIGNPVMIGMVLVWRIKDTYRAVFDIDTPASVGTSPNLNTSLNAFVRIQSDAALREVTGHYAYDSDNAGSHELTLRDGGDEINDLLERKLNERLAMAGMEVVEARLNYLAYAPEIAAIMLRRQQASAIISAREKIVEGAVSMVEMALQKIEKRGLVDFDAQAKARMVSNLLVVLCGDEPAQPIVNASNN